MLNFLFIFTGSDPPQKRPEIYKNGLKKGLIWGRNEDKLFEDIRLTVAI